MWLYSLILNYSQNVIFMIFFNLCHVKIRRMCNLLSKGSAHLGSPSDRQTQHFMEWPGTFVFENKEKKLVWSIPYLTGWQRQRWELCPSRGPLSCPLTTFCTVVFARLPHRVGCGGWQTQNTPGSLPATSSSSLPAARQPAPTYLALRTKTTVEINTIPTHSIMYCIV